MSEYKGYNPGDIGTNNSDADYYDSLEKRKKIFDKEHGKSNFSELLFWREIIREYEQIENTPWERMRFVIDKTANARFLLIEELKKKKKRNKEEEKIWQALDHHDTEDVLKDISVELGGNFDSHGFQSARPLNGLENILDNGISPKRMLNTVALRLPEGGGLFFSPGFDGPPTNSDFFIVSDYKKNLNYYGVGFVVLADYYKDSINLFKKRFPNFEFVLLRDLKGVLERKKVEAGEGK